MSTISELSEQYAALTVEELNKLFYQEIDTFSQDIDAQMSEIRRLIESLIIKMETYQGQAKMVTERTLDTVKQQLEMKKNLIYEDFFKLQNLINLFIYQKIVMTCVHIDPITGHRELRLFDNDISHLNVTEVNNQGRIYAKLGYEVSEKYLQLKNSLSDDENLGLQNTAKEVENRYAKYKGRILWKLNNDWYGYKLYNRGPINEAFVDFYLHEVQLKNSLNENLHQFMLSEIPQGVVRADNANGFLLGDISMGGLQFAVKGAYGSAQNFTMIITWLKEIQASNFSFDAFQKFIYRFKEVEQEKARALVKPLSKHSIDAMIRYHESELIKPLTEYGT